MNTRRTTIIVAVLLAIGTGWLTLTYLRSFQSANGPRAQIRRVLVASKDIPARAPINAEDLVFAERAAGDTDPDAIGDPAKIRGAISLISIPAGSVLTASKVGHPSDVGLAVRLKPGLRAISIAVDRVKDVSGLLEAGDHVDVISNVPKGPGIPPHASTIMRGVLVLAVGPALETAGATPAPDQQNAATVTLAVTPKQADLLMLADSNTTLRLTLRSPRENLRSEPVESLNLQGLAIPEPLPADVPRTAPSAVAAAPVPMPPLPASFSSLPATVPTFQDTTSVPRAAARGAVTVIEGDQVVR